MQAAIPPSVAQVLARPLDADPDREALVTRTRRLTYAQLDEQADRAAQALQAMGVRPGDRVAASLPNEADVVIAFHGAMRLGAIWVGVNRALAPPEKRFLLSDSGSTLLLSDDELPEAGARIVTVAEWREAVAAAPRERVDHVVDPFAPAGIAYTSGTTGHPKGAVHSQWNLVVPGAVLGATRGYDATLRKGDCLPLTILNMVVLTTVLVSQAGGTCIVMDRLDPEGVAEWIRDHRVTTWNGPPALLHGLATNDAVRPSDLATLDEVWTGGADCPEAIRTMFEAKFGLPVLATYGLSEAPTVVSIDPRGGPHVDGSSGRPLPHLAVRIAGEDGTTRPAGETGEVCIGADPETRFTAAYWGAARRTEEGTVSDVLRIEDGYRPMLGYWERSEATASSLVDGELRTGDVGFVDEDGLLHIRDRKSLVIIRGGANVYPAEVERVLQAAEGVAACAVLGVADERLGERVVAVVEPVAGAAVDAEALRAHCLAGLAKYKVPERFVLIDAFPRNAMGKIVRKDLPDLL